MWPPGHSLHGAFLSCLGYGYVVMSAVAANGAAVAECSPFKRDRWPVPGPRRLSSHTCLVGTTDSGPSLSTLWLLTTLVACDSAVFLAQCLHYALMISCMPSLTVIAKIN